MSRRERRKALFKYMIPRMAICALAAGIVAQSPQLLVVVLFGWVIYIVLWGLKQKNDINHATTRQLKRSALKTGLWLSLPFGVINNLMKRKKR